MPPLPEPAFDPLPALAAESQPEPPVEPPPALAVVPPPEPDPTVWSTWLQSRMTDTQHTDDVGQAEACPSPLPPSEPDPEPWPISLPGRATDDQTLADDMEPASACPSPPPPRLGWAIVGGAAAGVGVVFLAIWIFS